MKTHIVGLLVLVSLCVPVRAQSSLIVHEWGTITTRHAADGMPQGRLNRIEPSEVLPDFVHRYEPPQRGVPFGKGANTPGHPDVTMRLETPVIYFYGVGNASSKPFTVHVEMRGGILNEFYPNATATLAVDDARIDNKIRAGVLDPNQPIALDNYLRGSLDWANVAFDTAARPPQTDSAIWNAPRNVRAATLAVGNESERYLFYRGVAHLDALLSTRHSKQSVQLRAPKQLPWLNGPSMTLTHVWLVDVRANGTAAFTSLRQLEIAKNAGPAPIVDVPTFKDERYSSGQLQALRGSMHAGLVEAGLYDEEATAMLATWDASYFQTPGLRVFYLVPREWIDYFLPLKVSVPHTLTRVLIGRIDLL
jgi:hypothetical protein